MPSSVPSSSKARAKIRCSQDTPAPVIQCFLPFSTHVSPRLSARVVISVAALPASGSVMQIAGLSARENSTSAAIFFCVSVP